MDKIIYNTGIMENKSNNPAVLHAASPRDPTAVTGNAVTSVGASNTLCLKGCVALTPYRECSKNPS